MASATALPQPDDEFTVLVTGFAPFRDGFPQNPSWEIARLLPDYLPAYPPETSCPSTLAAFPRVRIYVHSEPIHVSYEAVRKLVPRLWDGREAGLPPKINLAIHIGMAGSQKVYKIERRGHRDNYLHPDVDDKLLLDDERRAREGEHWIWHRVPAELVTDLDVDDILRRWLLHAPSHHDLKVSENAGYYLCDFIYFSSLAHLWKSNERRRCLFLHVPADCSDETYREGRELVLQLIRSVVESELHARAAT